MFKNIYYWICKIIEIILHMYNSTTSKKDIRIVGIENILEKTFCKLEKKYFNELLLPELQNYFTNTKNSD
jgi:hypothetical protein